MANKSKSTKPIAFTMARRMSLYGYLVNSPVDFNNWSVRDICERASKDLKFPVHSRNLTSVLEHSDLNIKVRKSAVSPMSHAFEHIAVIAEAYCNLCKMIDVVPDPKVIAIVENKLNDSDDAK